MCEHSFEKTSTSTEKWLYAKSPFSLNKKNQKTKTERHKKTIVHNFYF